MPVACCWRSAPRAVFDRCVTAVPQAVGQSNTLHNRTVLRMKRSQDFWTGTLRLAGVASPVRGQDSPGTMAASIIARWSSMLGGSSNVREEITMTARSSGTTVISCPCLPDAL
jgi:hypothetical protein